MMGPIARAVTGRRRLVLALTILAVPILALVGGGVEKRLSVGGFVVPGAESTRAATHLEQTFATASPNFVLVAAAKTGRVTDPVNVAAGKALVAELRAQPGVLDVLSPWTLGGLPKTARNPLQSRDGNEAVFALRLGGDEDAQRATATELGRFAGDRGSLVLTPTGPAEVSREAAATAKKDLLRAELIAAPLTFLGLVLVFRGWRAASIPLVVALLAVLGTFTVLTILSAATTISVFALNLTTALGLGLAIDYSLLLVARFREERADGHDVETAIHRALTTAGRTVVISAATVMLSLLALLVFPVTYLRSFALAGAAVVSTAALVAVTVVPAMLARFGHRLGSERAVSGADGGFWARQARRVMRHPWLWALGVTALLVSAGVPFRGVDAGRIDDRALPAATAARTGADLLREDFVYAEFHPITVVVPWIDSGDGEAIRLMADRLLSIDGVERVDSVLGFSVAEATIPPTSYNERFRAGPSAGTWFSVIGAHDPETHGAEAVVREIRSLDPRLEVGGTTAAIADTVDMVRSRIPWALGLIALTTLVLLFFMTGSVVMPIKALLLNLLSLTATFGILVLVFQDGHLGSLLDITPTGRIDVFSPILVFCIAFGLSMDYEVFLLARIKESFDHSGDNAASVAEGLGHTGRMVTAAAGLLAVVFAAFATSGVVTVKMLGVGLGVAVLVDAFLVRATLVPALMKLAGSANWWAPAPLRSLHRRWGIHDGPVPVPGPPLHTPERVPAN